MKINCPECGMVYEVAESKKNAYMCCLGCDKFFKIKDSESGLDTVAEPEEIPQESFEDLNEKPETVSSSVAGKELASELLSELKEEKLAPKTSLRGFLRNIFTLKHDESKSKSDNIPKEVQGGDLDKSELFEADNKNIKLEPKTVDLANEFLNTDSFFPDPKEYFGSEKANPSGNLNADLDVLLADFFEDNAKNNFSERSSKNKTKL